MAYADILASLMGPGGGLDESMGVQPPQYPTAAPEKSFAPGLHDRILEAIYGGTHGIDFAQPHGFGQSFLQGLTGSLAGQGSQVAARRAKFEAKQTENRKVTDAQRIKATEAYNARRASAISDVAKEGRAHGQKQADYERDNPVLTAEMIAAAPEGSTIKRLQPGVRLARSEYDKALLAETPADKAAAKALEANASGEQVMTPRALKARVSIYRAGGSEPSFGMGKAGVANRVAFNEELAKQLESEGQTGADVMAGRATQAAEKVNLTNLVKGHGMLRQQHATLNANADLMLGLADKIPDTGIPLLNAMVRPGAEKVLGSTSVSSFNTALGVVQPEAARILTMGQTGGGQLSDSARHELQALVSGNFTKKQLRGSLAVIKRDADNREKAQQDEIDATKKRLSQIGTAQSRVPAEAPADFNFVPGKGLVPAGAH